MVAHRSLEVCWWNTGQSGQKRQVLLSEADDYWFRRCHVKDKNSLVNTDTNFENESFWNFDFYESGPNFSDNLILKETLLMI